MNPALLLAQFDRISDAPEGIPRLRLFILDLAVRGKLVEQDRRDEPASELLKRIQAEKLRLMKGNDVTKGKPIPPLAANDLPFLIPMNWCWTQLAKVGFINPRNTAPDELPASFVPMTLISAEYGVVNKHEIRPWAEIKSGYTHFAKGDVGLAKITPCFENRKSTVFRELTGGIGAGTTELHIVRPILTDVDFLLIFLKSPHFIETGIPKMTGTAGQKRVPTEYFAHSPFPLPPLAEQHRIVAKVDELMALCDRLEVAQAERVSRRDLLVASSLNSLNNGEASDAFRDHARFYFNHIPRLTTKREHIQQLRQAVLNLAVRGKLTPQDLNEEPAKLLLFQLTANAKAYAIEQGIAPPNPDPIAKENIEFPAPPGWEWVRLASLFKVITDGDHQPPPKANDGVAFLTIGNITTGKLDFSNCRFVEEKYWKSLSSYKKPAFGDILYTVVGATYGRPAYVDTRRHFCVQRHVAILKPTDQMNVRFLCSLLASPLVYEQATRSTTGTAQPTIPLRPLRNFLVLLPPLAEQHRIVAKVEKLMALCDRLEAQLTTTQTESRRLLEAVLHEALTEADHQELAATSCRSNIQEAESR